MSMFQDNHQDQDENCTSEVECRNMERSNANDLHRQLEEETFQKCPVCDNIYHTEFGLRKHINIQHLEKAFVCTVCTKGFIDEQTLERHMRIHTGDGCVLCPYCGLTFLNRSQLKRHVMRHSTVRRFQCHLCKTRFKQKDTLLQHIAEHNSNETYKCSVCLKSYITGRKLAIHMRTHQETRPHECTLCGRKFKAKCNLKSHVKIHYNNDGVSFQCPNCDKCFDKKCNLETHMKSHEGIKTHQCLICHKEYMHSWGLKEHMISHSANYRFKCPICGKPLKTYSSLRYHKATHDNEKYFKCSLCERKFSAKSTYEKHMRMHHEDIDAVDNSTTTIMADLDLLDADDAKTEGKVLCSLCGKWLKKCSLSNHLETHKRSKKYQCVKCNRHFLSERGFLLHENKCPGGISNREQVAAISDSVTAAKIVPDEGHALLDGDSNTNDLGSSTNDLERKSNDLERNTNDLENINVAKEINRDENDIKPRVGKMNTELLDDTIDIKDGEDKESCITNQTMKPADFELLDKVTSDSCVRTDDCSKMEDTEHKEKLKDADSDKLSNERPHECLVCKLTFEELSALRSHLLTHSAVVVDGDLQCTQCGKSFHNSINLITHVKSHYGQKTFECWVCHKEYATKESLHIHVLSKHVDDCPYISYTCDICGMELKNDSCLRYHQRKHNLKNEVKCTICGKLFDRTLGLKMHTKTHNDPIRTFECAKCGKSFESKINLMTHLKSHSGKRTHKCPECDKEYAHYSGLKEHTHRHSEDNPNKCESCGKQFTYPLGLRRHKLSNNDTRMFSCLSCKRGFKDKGAIKNHICSQRCEEGLQEQSSLHFPGSLKKSLILRVKNGNLGKDASQCNEHAQENVMERSESSSAKCKTETTVGPKSSQKNRENIRKSNRLRKSAAQGIVDMSHLKTTFKEHLAEETLTSGETCNNTVGDLDTDYYVGYDDDDPAIDYVSDDDDPGVVDDILEDSTKDANFDDRKINIPIKEEVEDAQQGYLTTAVNLSHTIKLEGKSDSSEYLEGNEAIDRDDFDETNRTDWQTPDISNRNTRRKPLRSLRYQKQTDGTEKRFKCAICGKRFHRKPGLEKHMITHNAPVNNFECAECGKLFESKINLTTHLKSHSGKRTYKCPQCDKEYAFQSGLKEHMFSHMEDNPNKCEICGKQFRNESGLRYHRWTHSDQKRFTCSSCGKGFNNRQGMQKHGCFKRHAVVSHGESMDCSETNISRKPILGSDNAGLGNKDGIKNASVGKGVIATNETFYSYKFSFSETCNNTISNSETDYNVGYDDDVPANDDVSDDDDTGVVDDILEDNMKDANLDDKEINIDIKEEIEDAQYGYLTTNVNLSHTVKLEGQFDDTEYLEFTEAGVGDFHKANKTEWLTREISNRGSTRRKQLGKDSRSRSRKGTDSKGKHIKCAICGKLFHRRFGLEKHMKTHDDLNSTFECAKCGKLFESKINLTTHLKSHSGKRTYKCPTCYKEYAFQSGLKEHMFSHMEDNPNKCGICGKKFRNESGLRYHRWTHSDQKRFTCLSCCKGFNNRQGMQKHRCLKRHADVSHGKSMDCSETSISKKPILGADNAGLGNTTSQHCEDAIKTAAVGKGETATIETIYSYKFSFSETCNNTIGDYDTEYNVGYDDDDPANDVIDDDDAGVVDDILEDSLKDANFNDRKVNIQIKEEIEDTQQGYLTADVNLNRTIKLEGKSDSSEYLEGTEAIDRDDFDETNRTDWLTPDISNRNTRRKQLRSLRYQKRTDGTEKRFKCAICGKQFHRKPGLEKHMITHDAPVNNFECAECGKLFESKINLTTHLKSHSGKRTYKCPTCYKEYAFQSGLKEHMFSHMEDNPNKCEICGKQFRNESGLRYHRWTHSDQKRFTCSSCGKGFNNRQGMQNHKCLKKYSDVSPGELMKRSTSISKKSESTMAKHQSEVLDSPVTTLKNQRKMCKENEQRKSVIPELQDSPNPKTTGKEGFTDDRDERLAMESGTFNATTDVSNKDCHLDFDDEATIDNFSDNDNLGIMETFKDSGKTVIEDGMETTDSTNDVEAAQWASVSENASTSNAADLADHFDNSSIIHGGGVFEILNTTIRLDEHLLPSSTEVSGSDDKKSHEKVPEYSGSDVFMQETDCDEKAQDIEDRPHKCSLCKLRFQDISTLQSHFLTHDTDVIQCTKCGKSFKHKRNLTTHMKKHAGKKIYECKICHNEYSTPSGLREHRFSHKKDQSLTCYICGKRTNSIWILRNHTKSHFNKEHNCTICDKHYKTKHSLEKHMQTHQNEKCGDSCEAVRDVNTSANTSANTSTNTSANLKNVDRTDMMDIGGQAGHDNVSACSSGDANQSDLGLISNLNDSTHQTITVTKTSEIEKETNVQNDVYQADSNSKMFKCNECKKVYSTRIGLRKHITRDHSAKPYVCPICSKNFTEEVYLRKHVKSHKDGKQHLCPVCGQTCRCDADLQKHLLKHTDARGFQCDKCGKSFKHQEYLKIHMAHHTEALVKCEICAKSYPGELLLARHMRTTHDAKRHECRFCDMTFRFKAALINHEKKHICGDYTHACVMCGKVFKSPGNLKTHMRSHEGKKTHECPICHKEYAHSWGLKAHMYSHSDNNPFKCPICGKQLKNDSSLRYHKRTHDAEKKFSCSTCGKGFNYKPSFHNHKCSGICT